MNKTGEKTTKTPVIENMKNNTNLTIKEIWITELIDEDGKVLPEGYTIDAKGNVIEPEYDENGKLLNVIEIAALREQEA
jgi:hypothetical protein